MAVAGHQFEYEFDATGNRVAAWSGGDEQGLNLHPAFYAADAVNQYKGFGHDADGNLTNDGHWSFIWDAENRLTSMETLAAVPEAGGRNCF